MRTPPKHSIHMDNHATTRTDARVLDVMMPYLAEAYGNAASRTHAFGWQAEEAVQQAREQVAGLIGARPKEIVFTSGATESDNLAIKGVVRFRAMKAGAYDTGACIVTMSTEHHAVLDSCRALQRRNEARVAYLAPRSDGLIDLDALRAAVDESTSLVSIMHANNEIGVLQPIREIAKIAHEAGALFHSDAAQSAGKIPLDVDADGIDLASISAHKMYGPKGVGALYVRAREPRVRLAPEMDGGGHERGMRSGTLNVAGIVGFGKACEIAAEERAEETERIQGLRDRLYRLLADGLDQVTVNGSLEQRLAGNLNVSFACVEGESLLMGLSDIAVSSGSACTSASLEPSYVLRAIGVSDELAHSSLRFGIGRFNTAEEIATVAERVIAEVKRLRKLSPLYRPEMSESVVESRGSL